MEIHLCGLEQIARAFRVKVETARRWRKLGAPIYLVGKKWQANYCELWKWIVANMIEKRM